ncbi:NEQ507 [Nanoarchaeum equitans Kin4-M]|uniref:DNA-directed RNA polymerase subunit Rpo5 n=1 Tax=Nanoarchaeum equitans (strain Kin4-M) TaxID=228908 RepID=Q74M66_NANEQ|nr:NEQ507 [Nanoarchaeum equitans Kin4-M]
MKKKQPIKHRLVPEYQKLTKEEVEKLLKELNIDSIDYLPKIYVDDPAIQHLNPKPGDVLRIIRKSPTAGKTIYYRVVIERPKIVEKEEEEE